MMELKPCPFCQSKNVKTFKYPSNVLDTGTDVFVQCQDCASDGPYGKDEQDAANRWNRRATDDNAALERAAMVCEENSDIAKSLAADFKNQRDVFLGKSTAHTMDADAIRALKK